ncbi:hypothetical protein OOT00_02710 [Desulfobotulus sp. H1]|uniref:Uncharacterized protein n=1 Tax=Desulfobotulus pelophilus TaxID=2823377 RepID=A0ABT3N604_9BACT|nr:hypothetical protein [Desulfobotulus pelophilus]MCW7752890.1 hypothetical protein [Desulfobotulus pelophilus]
MHSKSPYERAHLLAAAIRIASHQKKGSPPGLVEICELLEISGEEALFFIKKLESSGILETVNQAGCLRLFIRDMQPIETLPRQEQEPQMNAAIEAFQSRRQNRNMEIESFRKKQEEKQKALFEQLNRKISRDE